MTSQGSAYARFRRALATGNLTIIRAAAADLPQIRLDDVDEARAAFALMREAPEEALGVLQALCAGP